MCLLINFERRAATSTIEAWAFFAWILDVLKIYVWTEAGIELGFELRFNV